MLYVFPGCSEIKGFSMGILVAGQALLFYGFWRAIEDEAILHRFLFAFHDVQGLISAARAVADFAGYSFCLELSRLFSERDMALEAFWAFLGIRQPELLSYGLSLLRSQCGKGLGMLALRPD